jgi:energy-converting hydrogenase Eha subunit G
MLPHGDFASLGLDSRFLWRHVVFFDNKIKFFCGSLWTARLSGFFDFPDRIILLIQSGHGALVKVEPASG